MRLPHWLAWVLGAAVLTAVVIAALHWSEEQEFARLVKQAKPGWLAVALVLQAATYLAQAEVFRGVPLRAGLSLSRTWLYQLSLTKLFVDRALPSAGLSSTVIVAKALQEQGVARHTAAADATLVRNPRLFGTATVWQVAIFVLDAATMWVCIRSLGTSAPADAVFASFMVSSLVRTRGSSRVVSVPTKRPRWSRCMSLVSVFRSPCQPL